MSPWPPRVVNKALYDEKYVFWTSCLASQLGTIGFGFFSIDALSRRRRGTIL